MLYMGDKVFNPLTVAVVVDTPGHILGGLEWRENADRTDPVTKTLIDSKRIRIVREPQS